MDYVITKGIPEDYEKIIEFGNNVFNLEFPSLLPKLYLKHPENSRYHHLVKEGDEIRAMAEMKEEGCDLAVLGGQRQRYEYWGFTPCGISLTLNLNEANLKHCNIKPERHYEFLEYSSAVEKDLERAVGLYNSQPVHAIRKTENFIEILKSWKSRVFFLYINGNFAGYVSALENCEKILEIYMLQEDRIDEAAVTYMKQFHLNNIKVVLPVHRTTAFRKLSSFCENYSISSSANIYIINYINVVKAFLELKKSVTPLEEGTLIVDIKEKCRFQIKVKGEKITVGKTDRPFDISLSHLEAGALLFSHSGFIDSTLHHSYSVTKSWFPLPLFYPELDNV